MASARDAWNALSGQVMGGLGTVADVLQAPFVGAGATIRAIPALAAEGLRSAGYDEAADIVGAGGEMPRLKPGSGYFLEGPGLGEMAAEGYEAIGEAAGRELYPEVGELKRHPSQDVAKTAMAIPLSVVTEVAPPLAGASKTAASAARALARRTPLTKYTSLTGIMNPDDAIHLGVEADRMGASQVEKIWKARELRDVAQKQMDEAAELAARAGDSKGTYLLGKDNKVLQGARQQMAEADQGLKAAEQAEATARRIMREAEIARKAAEESLPGLERATKLRKLADDLDLEGMLLERKAGVQDVVPQVAGGTQAALIGAGEE